MERERNDHDDLITLIHDLELLVESLNEDVEIARNMDVFIYSYNVSEKVQNILDRY